MLTKEIEWKQLLFSTAIALVICLISVFFLSYIKQIVLEYSLNNSIIDFPKPEDYESSYNEYINGAFWFPFDLLIIFVTYYISGNYLVKRCRNKKHLNISLSVLLISVLIYQLDIIALLCGGLTGSYIAYKATQLDEE